MSKQLTGAELITAKRKRQIEVKGYSIESDKRYVNKELNRAACAICYESPSLDEESLVLAPDWAWSIRDKHQFDYKERLVIAGALIAAEIDRINNIKDNNG